MDQTMIKKSEAPLDNRDLQICQMVFDEVRAQTNIAKNCEEAERIATITVELYQQGVRDPVHLKTMVEVARGLFDKPH
ncbi:hypothetical protein [Neorhizobium sp. DT-125]|uniref:hypothetical protein n=1 Tax=Neorhizobium sp. DT-125 TaxID=3396163 RepID=UPI003F1AFABF